MLCSYAHGDKHTVFGLLSFELLLPHAMRGSPPVLQCYVYTLIKLIPYTAGVDLVSVPVLCIFQFLLFVSHDSIKQFVPQFRSPSLFSDIGRGGATNTPRPLYVIEQRPFNEPHPDSLQITMAGKALFSLPLTIGIIQCIVL